MPGFFVWGSAAAATAAVGAPLAARTDGLDTVVGEKSSRRKRRSYKGISENGAGDGEQIAELCDEGVTAG